MGGGCWGAVEMIDSKDLIQRTMEVSSKVRDLELKATTP